VCIHVTKSVVYVIGVFNVNTFYSPYCIRKKNKIETSVSCFICIMLIGSDCFKGK
jgi:hypothetical protein